MRILITGGLGHVGSAIARELCARHHEVWICDRGHSDGERYYRCDVSEYRQLEALFANQRFDLVYHAAAEFGRKNGEAFYENMWKTNVIGTKNVIRLQEKHKFKLVFFSSSEVYGDYRGVMAEEVMDNVEIKQLNDYALSKWVGEMQVLNSMEGFGTETVRVRLFNIYGPGERYSAYRSAVCVFIHNALRGIPYTVYRGHWRSWLFITDAARTLANITESFKSGEVYNIGSTEERSMEDISNIILSLVGRNESIVRYKDFEPLTTRGKKVEISKAIKDLDHRVSVPLQQGLKATVDWMSAIYHYKQD